MEKSEDIEKLMELNKHLEAIIKEQNIANEKLSKELEEFNRYLLNNTELLQSEMKKIEARKSLYSLKKDQERTKLVSMSLGAAIAAASLAGSFAAFFGSDIPTSAMGVIATIVGVASVLYARKEKFSKESAGE